MEYENPRTDVPGLLPHGDPLDLVDEPCHEPDAHQRLQEKHDVFVFAELPHEIYTLDKYIRLYPYPLIYQPQSLDLDSWEDISSIEDECAFH